MGRGETLKARVDTLQREQERRRRLTKLKRDTLRRIEFLKKRPTLDSHEVYHLFKEFFKGFLGKPDEFTLTELKAELRSIYLPHSTRTKLEDLFSHIAAVEYANVHYPRQTLLTMLDEFGISVHDLVRTVKGESSFFSRIRSLFRDEEPTVVLSELPSVEHADAQDVRIRTLAERCYQAIDAGSARKARAAYKALLKEYDLLDPERKVRYYPLVDGAFQALQR